jgi:hypothetical protein
VGLHHSNVNIAGVAYMSVKGNRQGWGDCVEKVMKMKKLEGCAHREIGVQP